LLRAYFTLSKVCMEKGFSPENLYASEYLSKMHQVMFDGQRELISFENTTELCLAIALRVLSSILSEERLDMFDPISLPSSDPASGKARKKLFGVCFMIGRTPIKFSKYI